MVNPHQQGGNMKIVSIEEVKNRIETKWKNQPFEIIEYTRVTKPFTIKCLRCGEIKTYRSFGNFISSSRKGVCICYSENNSELKHKQNQEKILKIIEEKENLSFVSFQKRATTGKYEITCFCSECKQNFTKTQQGFLLNPKCFYCESRENMNTKGLQAKLGKEYKLLSEFQGTQKSILIKHIPCGFIWKVKPKYFLRYPRCPKCCGKRSKGELKIADYFTKKEIQFETEKGFSWQSNLKRRYDFYVPAYNLVIEYMGEQHYFETNYFKIPYKEQIKIDKEKKEEAINNGLKYLAIGYFDLNRIEKILDCWFNDYSQAEVEESSSK